MSDLPSRRQILGGAAAGVAASFVGVPAVPAAHAADGATRPSRRTPAAATGGTTAAYSAPDPRTRLDLDTGWRFVKSDVSGAQASSFDDSAWAAVSTPHTWNATDGADGGNNYYRGVGWYRRHLTVPAGLAGRMLFLQFAGVNQVADVWVNGVHLGQHKGGYSRFRFGATDALLPGKDNVIAVKVTNAADPDIAPLSADYTFAGGIYRNVSLWAVDRLQVQMLDYSGPGIYLRQSAVTTASATVGITAKLWNNNTGASRSVAVRTVVADADGTVVADRTSAPQSLAAAAGTQLTQSVTVTNPRLWNGRSDPHLYSATVEIHDVTGGGDTVTDAVTEPLGLRSLAVDAATGFSLNGRNLALRGVNLHQDRAGKGWAISDADHTQDFDLIEEIGADAIRMAHYQHDQKDYNLADERGFVVWAEIPLVNATTNSAAFTASTENQLRELIRQNYNHPSIAFWSIGNEQNSDDTPTNTLLAALAGIVAAEDPDRLSTYASDLGDTAGVGKHTQVCAWNKYYGWYGGSKDGNLGSWADGLHASQPALKFGVSEYGAGANTTQHALDPAAPAPSGSWHPEEYQALFHEAAWKQIEARPFLWGTFVWNMFDFASDGRNEGSQPGINDKGLVTRDRVTRKDAFYFYKATWSTAPTLYITSRRWAQRTDAATQLKVYSNAAQVTASLNGVSLGTVTGSDHVFVWNGVTLRQGQNTASVTATINGTPYTDTVTWTLA
ncbi:glycoside hydrolase family 2 protein [Actinacidiphila rubida]|uniref:Beta-galactosidase n=1 Tax=Actinacidiphila rubida TaxID=310780 RepID=A0A1H8PYZ0_9ACTN|nr:glycoside hydrolase family 2 TIM barrel-domain containing protein [Actinacidiphila rubida]SEO47175.1 beta-galactosidase [Actinacidiphila rubida]